MLSVISHQRNELTTRWRNIHDFEMLAEIESHLYWKCQSNCCSELCGLVIQCGPVIGKGVCFISHSIESFSYFFFFWLKTACEACDILSCYCYVNTSVSLTKKSVFNWPAFVFTNLPFAKQMKFSISFNLVSEFTQDLNTGEDSLHTEEWTCCRPVCFMSPSLHCQ